MTNEEVKKMCEERAVLDLWPHAGQALGLTRNHTYTAAKKGDIKVIRIGRLLKVTSAWLRQTLGL
jgi:hypothetical protein